MRQLTFGLLFLGLSACKKDSLSGNLGTCKSIYETSDNSIIINEETNGVFCLLGGYDYKIDINSLNLTNIEWNTGDSLSILPINESGTYEGFGINNTNDTISFNFEAQDCNNHIYIPNSFTPNGDGINDYWQPLFEYSTVCDENYEISIFDSYHQLIFKTNNPNLSWDGSHKGSSSPQGIYHYILQYKREDGEAFEKSDQFLLMK